MAIPNHLHERGSMLIRSSLGHRHPDAPFTKEFSTTLLDFLQQSRSRRKVNSRKIARARSVSPSGEGVAVISGGDRAGSPRMSPVRRREIVPR